MSTDSPFRWYVMTHYDMKRFLDWLKNENARRLSEGRVVIEPFYPYDFLGEQRGTVSDDFVNFVFLKATKDDIDSLLNDPRNTISYTRLKHYRDTDGKNATVPARMMQEFLNACVKYRGRFEIIPPIRSIEVMDKVKITRGPFSGYEASVMRVRLSRGTINLDLAIQLVTGVMNIRMCDVDKNDVIILNRESTDAIREDFIEYTQNHLLTILEHRVKRVEDDSVNRRDADMLTRRYRHYQVKNDAARCHFMALMLICAHLCRYIADEANLREEVLGMLAETNQRSESKAATDTRTYLWIALYVSTHNPVYRDAAKQYVRDHQPKSVKLRRFVSLIRTGRKV